MTLHYHFKNGLVLLVSKHLTSRDLPQWKNLMVPNAWDLRWAGASHFSFDHINQNVWRLCRAERQTTSRSRRSEAVTLRNLYKIQSIWSSQGEIQSISLNISESGAFPQKISQPEAKLLQGSYWGRPPQEHKKSISLKWLIRWTRFGDIEAYPMVTIHDEVTS